MEFNRLVEVYNAGVSKVMCNADGTYTFGYKTKGPVDLNKEDMKKMLKSFGWVRYATEPDKLTAHMNGIIRKIKAMKLSDDTFNGVNISFEHSYVSDSVKNVWRTRLLFKGVNKGFTIIEGRSGFGGKYVVMTSEDHFTKTHGFSSFEDTIKFIVEKSRPRNEFEMMDIDELQDMLNNEDVELSKDEADKVKRAIVKKEKEMEQSNGSADSLADDVLKMDQEVEVQEVKNITADLY